jgi:hypothetical protein
VSGAWFLRQPDGWLTVSAPTESLDGSIVVSWLAAPTAIVREAVSAPVGDATTTADPAIFVQRAVGRVVDAYTSGKIHSAAAEALLEDLYLVDGDGEVWALGAQTGTWHTYEGEWRPASQPPGREAFRFGTGEARSPEQALAGLERFLAQAESLIPESIVADWSPPADFPEAVGACPHCGALNIGDIPSCVLCGRAILAIVGQAAAAAPATQEPGRPSPTARKGRAGWWLGGGCLLLAICATCALLAWALVGAGLGASF